MVTPAVVEPSQAVEQPLAVEVPQVELPAAEAAVVDTASAVPPTAAADVAVSRETRVAALPDEVAVLRRQVAQYEQERQRQATEAALTQESQQVYREALARGLTEEDATWIAQRYHVVARRSSEEQQRIRQEQMYLEGKQNAAAIIGEQYGVAPRLLMGFNHPDDMKAYAQDVAEREKRYTSQDTRLKALEQNRVQPQTLNVASGSQAGAVTLTLSNIDKLYVDHETQHPGTPNPYEAQYRRLLGMG